ncbi:molybdopterin-binding protein [Succinimonas amylolytica]|uniref:molybdopterin-binding protein n=1 Tax=Succinimonas amylolytica TaxID=83769 RepID=UPI00036FDDFF|nr:molybdopterin-binding protein [Succinimonas amylolytica]
MKKVAVQDAVGMRLCHDITEIRDGFKGVAFRRNTVIGAGDVEHLLNIGKRHLFVWDDSIREIHEDDCALRMAGMAPVPGAHYEGPSEGKVLLISDTAGLFLVNRKLLGAVNEIPDLTITSLPNHYAVKKGARMASMRIVPLVTAEENILRAEELCRKERLFELHPYRPLRTGIIITGSEIYSGRISDRFEPVLRSLLKRYPGEVLGVRVCDDDTGMIAAAAEEFIASGADLLLFTGGMSVDPDDVTPRAIRETGAEILTHGMPAQPGNMTLLAYRDQVVMLGVPGAAISRPVTLLDVLLPQIFAGIRFSRADLLNLAEGGLCQLCGQCHYPNCTFGRY